eukprot:494009-Prymnesium_polylepis.1
MPDKTTQLSDLEIARPRAILHIHPSMASTAPQWADAPDGGTQPAPFLRLHLNRYELCVPTAQAASGTHRRLPHADSTLSSLPNASVT